MADGHPRRHRIAMAAALLGSLVALTAGVGSASAAFIHKAGVSERFGSDGTEATTVEDGTLALDQSRHRLFAGATGGNNTQIYAFDVPAHTSVAGKFPVEVEASGSLSVDQSSGQFYLQSFFRGIFGWQTDGTPL